ncbi:MAG: hypothetical protein LC104_12310 [Bacteroidales bacterium]|nr:hypothetical protein [Bacteroidales bacterium]
MALVIVALGLNAVAIPYFGLFHDSILYGVQTLNQVDPGHFQQDLFFKYGSQDQFSLFSTLAALLAKYLGLSITFYLIYFASKIVLLLAFQQFVCLIEPTRRIASATFLYFSVSWIAYGGLQIFHVNESFTTPRLPAIALTVLAITFAMRGRWVRSLVILLAFLLHPIMAMGGLIGIVGLFLWDKLGGRWVWGCGIVGMVGLTVLIGVPELGQRVFGTMSPDWKAEVLRMNPYNFPETWAVGDWQRILVAVALVGYGIVTYSGSIRRMLVLILITGVGGLALTEMATRLPYALLFQGQPYRAIWLIHLAQIPIAASCIVRFWNRGNRSRTLAVLLLAHFAIPSLLSSIILIFLIMVFAPAMVGIRGISRQPRRADWFPVTLGIAVCGAALMLFAVQVLSITYQWHVLFDYATPEFVSAYLLRIAFPVAACIMAGCMLLLTALSFRVVIVVSVLLMMLASWPLLPVFQRLDGRRATFDFVSSYIQTRSWPQDRTPTIYFPGWEWKIGAVDFIWFDLQWNNYFATNQLAGNMFNESNAMEGKRRSQLVAMLELPNILRYGRTKYPAMISFIQSCYGYDAEPPPPTPEDLLRLCQEPDLDLIVIPYAFPGLYSATDGTWYIYDPAVVRTQQRTVQH